MHILKASTCQDEVKKRLAKVNFNGHKFVLFAGRF